MTEKQQNELRDSVLASILQALESEICGVEIVTVNRDYYTGFNYAQVKFKFNKELFTHDIMVEELDRAITNALDRDNLIRKVIKEVKGKIEGKERKRRIGF